MSNGPRETLFSYSFPRPFFLYARKVTKKINNVCALLAYFNKKI